VIDTNVVLDLLVFANPAAAPLARALQDGALRWVATAAMLDELRHVLQRPLFQARRPEQLEDILERDCRLAAAPPDAPPRLLCSDPDDQKFIDLALHRGSRWLISRDRALLKLARRAHGHGVQVCPPATWAAGWAASCSAPVRTSI
jgi:predicted nucleic acid-binding protein